MKKILHKILKWIFAEELQKLKQQTEDLDKKIEVIKEYQYRLKEMNITMDSYRKSIENILGNIDISVDIHQYSRSQAVISLQGTKSDYIKFVDLGDSDIHQIKRFLEKFSKQNIKIDAPYNFPTKFLKIT